MEKELRQLLNKYSAENESNTPDWILAQFMLGCLNSFNQAVVKRDGFFGYKPFGENGVIPLGKDDGS